jgi:hypothetical protein
MSIKMALAKNMESMNNFIIKGLHEEIVKSVRSKSFESLQRYTAMHPTINDYYERNCQLHTEIFLLLSITLCLCRRRNLKSLYTVHNAGMNF